MCNFNIFRICAYLCGNLYQGDFFQEALVFVSRNLYFFSFGSHSIVKHNGLKYFVMEHSFFLLNELSWNDHGITENWEHYGMKIGDLQIIYCSQS